MEAQIVLTLIWTQTLNHAIHNIVQLVWFFTCFRIIYNTCKYRWTSLYARDRDQKNWLAYNEFAYKNIMDTYKSRDRLLEKNQFLIACM
jgi:hypothetical protein